MFELAPAPLSSKTAGDPLPIQLMCSRIGPAETFFPGGLALRSSADLLAW